MVELAQENHHAPLTLRTTPDYTLGKIGLAVAGALLLHVLVFGASFFLASGKPKAEKKETLVKTEADTQLVSPEAKNGKTEKAPVEKSKAGDAPKAAAKNEDSGKPKANAAVPDPDAGDAPTLPKMTGLDDGAK